MRILLADNRSKVRFALRALLEQRRELEIVGEAVDAENLLAQAEATHPDLVLFDWGLPGRAAIDLLPALRQACPALSVIVLSGRTEAEDTALSAGADAFVSKADPPEHLLAAIANCWRRQQAGLGVSGAVEP
jgi:two-component system capsular synthesis response regulator RcsB